MAPRSQWRCLVLMALLASAQAAGGLDDFSNNLFSDLAPLLALFGERVTMQFMSQSLGWADCIALAMAPLGVITIIVSAIRVGGPMRLKAIIGRAKENTSVAEMELMSSTSREVCEMYNGESIVRCQGSAPVWEYICLVPQSTKAADSEGANSTESMPKFVFKTLKQAVAAGLLSPERQAQGSDDNENHRTSGEVPTESPEAPVASVQNEEIPPVARSTAFQRNLSRIRPWFRRGKGPLSRSPEVSLEMGSIHQQTNAPHPNNDSVQRLSGPRAEEDEVFQETSHEGPEESPGADFEEESHRDSRSSSYFHSEEDSDGDSDEASQQNPDEAFHQNPNSIIVVRNTGLEAPNISLNLSMSHSRTSIRWVATMGVLLQLCVVTFFGVITFGPSYIRDDFEKDDKAALTHAFPLAAGGTMLLVTGLLLCAHVVESSTNEQRYKPSSDYRIQIYWLQQGQTVNDQIFESFATFPSSPRTSIITSRRGKDFEKEKDIKTLQFKTTIGVFISLAGFITQFVGLRAMNAAASLAQLGAVGIMTVARAMVRPGFASSFEKVKILPGYEIDWLAWKLIKELCSQKTHDTSETQNETTNPRPLDLGQPENNEFGSSSKSSKYTQTEFRHSPGSWGIVTGKNSEYHPFKPSKDLPGPMRQSSTLADVRRELSKLANFRTDSSNVALNLAIAMEKILTVFFPGGTGTTNCDSFLWDVKTFYEGITPNVESNETMRFQLKMVYNTELSSWKVMADDLDAVLSLWIYTINERNIKHETTQVAEDFEHLNSENDSWLRNKTHPASLRILRSVDDKMRMKLFRDLRAWAPKACRSMFYATEDIPSTTGIFQKNHFAKAFNQSRVVGFNPLSQTTSESQLAERQFQIDISSLADAWYSPRAQSGHWVIETQETLDVLYAKDLLFHFLSSAAKTLQTPLRGRTVITTPLKDITWRKVFLHYQAAGASKNECLDEIIESIISLGLGLEHEVTLGVVLTLSFEDKLPVQYSIFESLRDQKIEARKERNWGRPHMAVYHLRGRHHERPQSLFSQHLFAFLIDHAEDIEVEYSSTCVEGRDDRTLHLHQTVLLEYLRALRHRGLFDQLKRLYEFQRRNMRFLKDLETQIFNTSFGAAVESSVINKRLPSSSRTESSESLDHAFSHSSFTPLHREAMKPDGKPELYRNFIHWINQPDTFGLMPLYHALRTGNHDMVKYLVRHGADVEAKNFRGYTALHFACGFGDEYSVALIRRAGAKFDVQGSDGAFPLHVAAAEGNHKYLAFLNHGKLGNWGNSFDLWKAKDFHGRLPVHWAVMAGNTQLFSRDNANTPLTRYVNEADNYGWTALHLAVIHSKNDIVRELCSENWHEAFCVDKEKTDAKGLTAFQLAGVKGNSEAADILRDAGARTEF
ncbi:Putative ankyrin repeat-containing domain superfamily [Colletotrichum destructivum]|uniref:protein S-acyltransferase n=1 Tax=Colletotrichum destructivum TaxID=34406 RepID=A0AAX4IWG8_9PEZI|nr:Putative ankyrin repeat-containing domain superfamily [Colletotrichum destructivum]